MAKFLIYRQGPLIDLFEGLLAGNELVDAGKKQKGADFDLVIIDGDSVGADLGTAAQSARQAVDADKPVLVLRPTRAIKAALAAAGALRTYPDGESVAFLIDPYHAEGKLRFRLAEQFAVNHSGGRLVRTSGGETSRGRAASVSDVFHIPPSLPNIMDVGRFAGRVRAAVERSAALLDSTNPPANIPAGLWDVTPVNLYFPQLPNGQASSSGYTPPQGSLYFEGLVTIGVYYDNTSFNQAVQWLFIEHAGLYYTAGLEANDSTHVGWSVAELVINGANISGPTLVTKQSSPNNVNGQTNYESNTSFSVGISAGTDGLSVNASYTIGSSVSNAISDWGIVQSSPDSWSFAQQVPYNGATQPGTFPSGAADGDGVAALPPISAGSLAYDTQTVWVQLPASNTNASIAYTYQTQAAFTYSSATGKSWAATCWLAQYNYSENFALNWASAWPS
jgi:hypothetical protein